MEFLKNLITKKFGWIVFIFVFLAFIFINIMQDLDRPLKAKYMDQCKKMCDKRVEKFSIDEKDNPVCVCKDPFMK
ncbi:MAG: hypothetical protein KDK36_06555 [Leptospiraceae bacterium]|nr:hypothetical protein [Leptospiraceae bacterium]